jgi:flavin reductase (DIM6/NTAB) family NADH-FMN oxidoreductase RutF
VSRIPIVDETNAVNGGSESWADSGRHLVVEPRVHYYGTPVVLVSTTNPDGSANLAPMSSAWWIGNSCLLGLDETSQTTLNLQRTRELVLNLPDTNLVDAVDRLAGYTGAQIVPPHKAAKGYEHLADKFGRARLTPVDSHLVTPPRVGECPIQMESKVKRMNPFSDPGSGVVAIEVEIIRTHVREDMLVTGSNRHIDPEQWDPLIMKFTHYYGRARHVHPSRLAEIWQIPPILDSGSDHQ